MVSWITTFLPLWRKWAHRRPLPRSIHYHWKHGCGNSIPQPIPCSTSTWTKRQIFILLKSKGLAPWGCDLKKVSLTCSYSQFTSLGSSQEGEGIGAQHSSLAQGDTGTYLAAVWGWDLALWGYLLPFLCSPFSDRVLMSSRPPAALTPYVE